MKPLKQRKNPVIAFILGFFLQGIGVGLYLESWIDFFACVGAGMFLFVVLLPTVVARHFATCCRVVLRDLWRLARSFVQ